MDSNHPHSSLNLVGPRCAVAVEAGAGEPETAGLPEGPAVLDDTVEVHIVQCAESVSCRRGESVLKGLLRLGRRSIPAGCLGGGCGICKVRILQGQVIRLGAVSRDHVSADEESAGITLACKVSPDTALHLEVLGYLESRLIRGGLVTRMRSIQSTRGDR